MTDKPAAKKPTSATTSSTTLHATQSPIKEPETDSITANFTGVSSKQIDKPVHTADKDTKERTSSIVSTASAPPVQSSPLLSSTPPTVSKSLIRAYPYLIYSNKVLGVLTWTDDNVFLPIALVLAAIIFELYFEVIVTFFGHLLPVLGLSLFSLTCAYVDRQQEDHPTLDDVVQCLSSVGNKSEKLLQPITSLNLTAYDLKRLLFTTIFLSPIYVLVSFFLLSPKAIVLASTVFTLTYHSTWSRVTRKLLWKSKTVRLICFYLTGLDFEPHGDKDNTLFNYAVKKTNKTLKEVTQKATGGQNGPTRFTYVLYENQRRWLGIGWTPNLLSYERTPWTDEFLNEADAPESFELPQLDDDSGMYWRWIDKTWRVDLTNDAAIQLSSTKSKTTADPKPDDGWIYYDNTWKSPSTEDSFSKYTRKRRWVRTAELVSANGKPISTKSASTVSTAASPTSTSKLDTTTTGISVPMSSPVATQVDNVTATGDISTGSTTAKKRKNLRFNTPSTQSSPTKASPSKKTATTSASTSPKKGVLSSKDKSS